MDYCDVFIICLDSHSDGTHSLYICDVMLLDGLRETFAANFHFGFECESN